MKLDDALKTDKSKMTIKTIRKSKQSIGQKLIVKNDLEYQFAKLNFNKNVKIIFEGSRGFTKDEAKKYNNSLLNKAIRTGRKIVF
jgi:hypothetical protein